MRVQQAEGCIVADGAEVAEMIGDALQLRHQRPDVDRARRRCDVERGFDRAGERDRGRDSTVARNVTGKARRALERGAAHQRVDAFVYVAEAFLEADDRLAACREAEMARLDNARVNRSNGNLVKVLA